MTFTLVAADTARGLLGVATASKSLAVGRSVPGMDPSCGAVASQAWTNRRLRHHMLSALSRGASPQEAVGLIPALDEDYAYRQVSVVDLQGRTAAHTGQQTSAWSGHLPGEGFMVSGNLLAGPQVLEAMHRSFTASRDRAASGGSDPLWFAHRLVEALAAGEAAGGDLRGKESAAVVVAGASDLRQAPPELAVDLRVDHHQEPVAQLGELLRLSARSE